MMAFGERAIRTAVLALLLYAQATRGFSVAGQQERTCEDNGSVYFVGEWYFLDSDHCTQCECTAEGSACSRTECTSLPAACIHVSHYPTDCCPRCEKIGCEYRGVVYDLGQNFQVRLGDAAECQRVDDGFMKSEVCFYFIFIFLSLREFGQLIIKAQNMMVTTIFFFQSVEGLTYPY